MKTKSQLQTAIDEIQEVCRKHGIYLVGTSYIDGQYGEITLFEKETLGDVWLHPHEQVTNEVAVQDHSIASDVFMVTGIG